MQVVVDLLLHEVTDKLVYADSAFGGDGLGAQLDFGLALEHGFLDVNADGGYNAVADVHILISLAAELLDDLGDVFLEGCLMGASQGGVLSVDKGVVLLSVLVAVGEGYLYVLALQVDDVVERVAGHAVGQQVAQSVAAEDAVAVEENGEAGVEIGVVAEHGFYELLPEGVVLEKRVVGLEEDIRAVLLPGFRRGVGQQHALFKDQVPHLPLAEALHLEMGAQGIHGLQAHAIQAHALLECLAVILGTRVEHAHGLEQFSLWDAAAVVAHRHVQVVCEPDLDSPACIHLELVDAVVHHFLEQYIHAVLGLRPVTQASDVHARPGAHMLHVRKVPDIVLFVLGLGRHAGARYVLFHVYV